MATATIYSMDGNLITEGVITVTFEDPSLSGQTVTLTPSNTDGHIRWACTSSLPAHLKPKEVVVLVAGDRAAVLPGLEKLIADKTLGEGTLVAP